MESKGLAERREDILPLATHFLAKTSLECGAELKQLSESAINLLQSYDWPGNVRELENFIERAVVFSDGEFIGPEAFEEIFPGSRPPWPEHGALPGREPAQPLRSLAPPPSFEAESGDAHFVEIEHWPTLGDVEAAHVRKTLRETFFNQSAAARMLGIDRKSLARKIKKYGIELPKPGAINRLPK
jgi:Nif-specific regulatory protein